MKMSPQIYAQMKSDIAHVLEAENIPMTMPGLWAALNIVSRNRAYDDGHPAFQSGAWRRVLPYDGRDFCWFYANDCNDTHVTTALRRIMEEI